MDEFSFNNPSFEQSVMESTIVTNGLVMYFDSTNPKSFFNGNQTWTGLTPNNNTSSFANLVYTSSYGGVFKFNGSNTYAACTNIESTILSGSFSVSCWMFSSVNGSGANLEIWSSRGQNGAGGVDLAFNYPTFGLHGDIGNASSYFNSSANVTYTFTISTWYNVCCVYTPSTFTYYVNGVSIGGGTTGGTPILTGPTFYMTLGAAAKGAGSFFNGYLNNFGVYNRVLTTQEIAQNFSASKRTYGYL